VGLALFGLPVVVTELIAFRHNIEFVDLLDRLAWRAGRALRDAVLCLCVLRRPVAE
jgi:hypothetical protein